MTAQTSTLTNPPSPILKAFLALWQEVLSCFRSVQLAIILLSLIAIATMVGVMMPQEGLVELAQIKQQYGPNFRMLRAMGLFTVYSSPWFMAIQVLFFFNLLIGSFKWLKPAYLAATQKLFLSASQIRKMDNRFEAAVPVTLEQGQQAVQQWLKKHRYSIHANPNNANEVYACKGNWTRFGPHIAHIGILLLLIACVYGTFTGFKAQKMAAPNTTFSLTETEFFKTNINEKYWLGSTPEWKVHINDFRVLYYPNDPKTVQQYYADLSINDVDGKLLKRQTISVNHPVELGDVTIYQASYNPTGNLFVEINGKPRTLKVDTQFEDRKVSVVDLGKNRALIVFPFIVAQDPGADANKLVVFMKTEKGFLGAGPGKMPENLRLREGDAGELGGVQFRFLRPEFSTGLQIKKAPEVPMMYLSYLIISLGALICILSQRQLWFSANTENGQTKIAIAYKTNKGRLSFLKELKTLQDTLLPPQGKQADAKG